MFDLVISIVVMAAIALALGSLALWRRGLRKQAALMAVLVLVMAANVAIWLVPDERGATLAATAD